MSPGPQQGIAVRIASLGRHWIWVMAFGIVTSLAGLAALAWPGPTVAVIAVLFGVQLILLGIFQLVAAFASEDLSGMRVLSAVLGLLACLGGLYAVRHLLVSVAALVLLLGLFWVANGLVEISTAVAHHEKHNRGWAIFTGLVSILAGLTVLAYPGISLLTLSIVLGAWLLVYGILEIGLAIGIRSAVGRLGDLTTRQA